MTEGSPLLSQQQSLRSSSNPARVRLEERPDLQAAYSKLVRLAVLSSFEMVIEKQSLAMTSLIAHAMCREIPWKIEGKLFANG